MKNLKKLAALVLSVMMLLSLMVSVSAEAETGSITINGVGDPTKSTYEIYELLDLESYDKATGAYSYTVNTNWAGFFATDEAKAYVSVDASNYATWIAADDDSTVAAFAKAALAYAKANGIAPVKSSKNAGEFAYTAATESAPSKGVFSGLELGYYLVDSTMGALCGLTTTNPDASINAKNGQPIVDKVVKEDSTNQWVDANTADIGQTVEFRTTISVHAGAENYVLHDIMSDGLTFLQVSKIEHVVPVGGTVDTHLVDPSEYEVVTEGLDESCTLEDGPCTFEVRFSKELCDHVTTNDKLIVYYEAMLNRNAIIAGDGNKNETVLDFGEGHTTTYDSTTTKTFGFDIVKTDSQNTLIDGAEFRIYDAAEGGNEVGVVLMDDGVTYRRARADEMEQGKSVSIVVQNGQVRVVGFDNGTYYLEETVAPDGYNKLASRQRFIIADGNLDAVFNDGIFSTGSGVHVINKTGTVLPETGGIGTTIFYAVGGALVVGAVVLLITKKRMQIME